MYVAISLYFTGTSYNVLESNTPLRLTREVLCATATNNNDVLAI